MQASDAHSEFIDGEGLLRRLDVSEDRAGHDPVLASRALAAFKEAFRSGWEVVRRRFEEEAEPGFKVVRAEARLVDELVRTVHRVALAAVYPAANPTTGEQLSLAAVGGYGRGELAPYSDIDLMVLHPYKLTPHVEQVVEYLLYTLWDMGLKVGHGIRSVDDAIRLARADPTIRTSLLEARWLAGDRDLFDRFVARFEAEVVDGSGAEFVEAKLAERDARHVRMGGSRYVLEPNVKDGKGGLRDLHTLYWIAKYLYRVNGIGELVDLGVLTKADSRHFAKAENFLWTVRCHLHYMAGRAEERLTFDAQGPIGARMGYKDRAGTRGVERFMKHYFLIAKEVGDLTRILCAVLEEEQKIRRGGRPRLSFSRSEVGGFRLDGGRLAVEEEGVFAADPVKLLRLFHEAHRLEIDIHPRALRLVRQNLALVDERLRRDPEANRLFLEMLTARREPDRVLTRLNEAGVFGRFLPDFGRVVAQMQYDMYHVYTVDEHTIRAIGILGRIEAGELRHDHPVASAVIGDVQSRRVLYLGVLLHDIAKGRDGDHSEIGAAIGGKLGPRLGLSDWETETVAWLVRHHLLMSRTAFKRDIDDPKTLKDFVDVVQSPERLRLLLVLTVADIRAVGPNVWNAWKASLLRELYYRASEVMTGGLPAERRGARVETARTRLREQLADWKPEDLEAHLARCHDDYWLAFDGPTHVRHAELVRAAQRTGLDPHVETRVEPDRDVTEVVIYTEDRPGLFASIAGAIALTGASIVDAKVMTLANGKALDTFWIKAAWGGAFESGERLRRLCGRVEAALAGRLDPAGELERARRRALPARAQVFKVPPRVLVDNGASGTHTVIEINGRDRLGFLHDVTSALTASGLQISSAHVSTYGERVVDVFYVKDIFGLKVVHERKLGEIRRCLLAAIDPSRETVVDPVAEPATGTGAKGPLPPEDTVADATAP